MALTLNSYAKELTPDLIRQAKKNKVRECDEVQKGHFVAYVDDGSESFDVSLTIPAGKEIAGHTCECNSTAIVCKHKVALIIHIAEAKKTKSVVKVKKKESKTESLLADMDFNLLKEWVKGLIDKNKDIELSFINHFSDKEDISAGEVVKRINDAAKVVAGNKKAVDLTQLKKIIQLWTEITAPVIEHYQAAPANEKSFLNFHAMLDTFLAFQTRVFSESNKIEKLVEKILQQSIGCISNLQAEEARDKSIGYFINHIPNGINDIRVHYLFHIKNVIGISSEDQKLKIIKLLISQFAKTKPEGLHDSKTYVKFIFELLENHNLLSAHVHLFKPIRFDNEFNQKLIELLIANNNLPLAKKYCKEQIEYNFREEYDIPYLKLLREILLIQKDEAALVNVLTALFPYTFNFDDYIFISERLPEEERKKWRSKMLTKAKNPTYSSRKDAVEFCFKMADTERNYKKMIDYIDSNTPYSTIVKYFERMVIGNKEKLLKELLTRNEDSSWMIKSDKETDKLYFPELFKLIEKNYDAAYLKLAVKSFEKTHFYFRQNNFFIYVKSIYKAVV